MSAPGRSASSRLARKRLAGRRALLATLMLLVAVASAFPLLWMVLSSLKTPAETMQVPPVWIPHTPTLEAYENVSGVINVGRSMWNSLVIASITTAGILVTSMMAGYAFAKHHFPGRSLLFSVLIATMFLPPIVTLIPLYRLVGSIGLNASLAGIIVPNLANAFGIPDAPVHSRRARRSDRRSTDGWSVGTPDPVQDRRAERGAGNRGTGAVCLRLSLE
ncbi:carbohydrate ABC transporter permease [Mesorhizobium sp. M0954]